MFKATLYTVKKETTNMTGSIYLPKGSGCGQKIKYFDAMEWGVPVGYLNGKKIINRDHFEKILEKHLTDGKELEGHCFEKCSFKNVSFAGLSLYNTSFKNCELENCNFNSTRFHDCLFAESTFSECSFDNSICYINAKAVKYTECSFFKAILAQTSFDSCTFENCNLHESYLRHCSFFKNMLEKPDFSDAVFSTVYFHDCMIHGAVYEGLEITMGGATSEEVHAHRNLIINALT